MNTPQSKSSINTTTNKLINSSSSDSPVFQDSPVFNYISNLSPIQPVKAEPGAQGFPGLASSPLVFTSPQINSLQSLLNRKLQSPGSLDFPQVNDKCHKNDVDSESSTKAVPYFNNLFISKEQRACSGRNSGNVAQCSPGCVDDFICDPDASSSCKRRADDASQSQISGSLQKRDSGTGDKVDVYGSTAVKVNKVAQSKSRISIKVVKNEVRHLIPSSDCTDGIPRSLTEHPFEICRNGDSLNEAINLERGTLRRCLFEENQRKFSDGAEFRNFSDNLARMEEICLSSSGTLDNRESINHHKPASGASCVSPVPRRNHVTISKPLGIGLHLNSVVYPRSLDSSNASQLSSLVGLEGKNSVLKNKQLDRAVNATIVGKVSATSEKRLQDKCCSIATSSEAKPSEIEHHPSSVLLRPDPHTDITCIKRKISPETAENNEVSFETSAKKKRKKSSGPSDDDHPKRCNCKKTKCLKLYCDCFAAGLYCTESCACQGCCNRPEQESTVLETRQQIETRNPLAFAPKVVPLATDLPASSKEVQNLSTPASARHKRGCNCRKSMCLKKYCECYQGNVGCSDGCRCEGCQNVFGIREDDRIIRGHMIRKVCDEMSEANIDRSHESTRVGSNFGGSRLHNSSPNLTLATPGLQCLDLKKNTLNPGLSCIRVLHAPDSQTDVSTSDENFLTCPEKIIECMDEGALQVEKSFENTEDNLQSVGDECTSTRILMSNSLANSIIPPYSSKTNNSGNALPPPCLDESVVPPVSSSLRWRSSPLTPITQSARLVFQDFDSGSKNSDMIEEDETPDVLKDSSNPANSVKVSSPNKKRISAPQTPIDSSRSLTNDSPHQNPSDSSGSLKVCHRFVLRALPAFPSLTPFSKK